MGEDGTRCNAAGSSFRQFHYDIDHTIDLCITQGRSSRQTDTELEDGVADRTPHTLGVGEQRLLMHRLPRWPSLDVLSFESETNCFSIRFPPVMDRLLRP